MARPKGSKNRNTGCRFKDFEGRFPNDKHLRLTKDMLMDNSFICLSSSASKLYLYMKLWACGRSEFDFSISMSSKIMSKPTFLKARDELIQCGFIDFPNRHNAKYKKDISHFVFSNRWQEKTTEQGQQSKRSFSVIQTPSVPVDEYPSVSSVGNSRVAVAQ